MQQRTSYGPAQTTQTLPVDDVNTRVFNVFGPFTLFGFMVADRAVLLRGVQNTHATNPSSPNTFPDIWLSILTNNGQETCCRRTVVGHAKGFMCPSRIWGISRWCTHVRCLPGHS